MKMKCWVSAFAGLLLALLTGCHVMLVGAGAAAGAGAVAYVEGELKTVEAVKFDALWSASLAGITQMEFTISQQTKDGTLGKIIAHGAKDRRVEVNLKKVTDGTTELRIRIGILGDEQASHHLLDQIRGNYKKH